MTAVSIITPAYHAEDTIARAVKSVLAQAHAQWEMIIVADDGQDYAMLLHRLGINDTRLRFASTGGYGTGPGAARNTGLQLARYDMIANLDADDALAPDYLKRMLPAAQQYGACTARIDVIEQSTGALMHYENLLTQDAFIAMPDLMRHFPTFAPIMFNRRWVSARWPELHYGEDLILWLLLLDELPAIYYASGAGYTYHYRRGSLSRPEEKTTHGICERRNKMMAWLKQHPKDGQGGRNRVALMEWLSTCNAMEESFGYTLVDIDQYLREVSRRFAAVFTGLNTHYNLAYA